MRHSNCRWWWRWRRRRRRVQRTHVSTTCNHLNGLNTTSIRTQNEASFAGIFGNTLNSSNHSFRRKLSFFIVNAVIRVVVFVVVSRNLVANSYTWPSSVIFAIESNDSISLLNWLIRLLLGMGLGFAPPDVTYQFLANPVFAGRGILNPFGGIRYWVLRSRKPNFSRPKYIAPTGLKCENTHSHFWRWSFVDILPVYRCVK